MGSPSVAGSMTLRRSLISVVSRLDRCRRPPPLRRTRPFGRGAALRSFSPRPIVENARAPVISETTSRPPHPVARTSPAAEHPPPPLIELRPDQNSTFVKSLACRSCRPAYRRNAIPEILSPRVKSSPGLAQSDPLVATDVLTAALAVEEMETQWARPKPPEQSEQPTRLRV